MGIKQFGTGVWITFKDGRKMERALGSYPATSLLFSDKKPEGKHHQLFTFPASNLYPGVGFFLLQNLKRGGPTKCSCQDPGCLHN